MKEFQVFVKRFRPNGEQLYNCLHRVYFDCEFCQFVCLILISKFEAKNAV